VADHKLIYAKIRLPYSSAALVERPYLIQRLADSYREKKLILVTAPAGYGKTSLVYQFVKSQKIPVVWYQLDSFDNRPELFMQYMIEAISEKIDGIDIKTANNIRRVDRQLLYYHKLLAYLLNELTKKATDGMLIVLEDFHLITDSRIIQMVEYIINYLPEGVHLIISSRFKPEFSIPKLRANDLIMELEQGDLQFSNAEIESLVKRRGITNVRDDIIQQLAEKTERWPLGLALSFIVLKDSKYRDLMNDLTLFKTKEEIYNYLALEVFNNLPENIRSFMTNVSVLANITPEACDYLLGCTGSIVTLYYIEKRNLFIERTNTVEAAFRFHHMFKDFLADQLSLEDKNKLLIKAGHYYLNKSLYEIAAEYYIAAGDFEGTAMVTKKAGFLMLQNRRIMLVDRWLKYLDSVKEPEVPEEAELIMLKGALFTYQGKYDEAEILMDRALEMFKKSGDIKNISKMTIHKAKVMENRTSSRESLKFINMSLPKVKELPAEFYIEAIGEKVYNQWLTGDIRGAVETSEKAIAEDKSDGKELTLRLYAGITVLYFIMGEYSKALSHFERILNEYPEMEQTMWESFGIHIAHIYRGRGELDKAKSIMLHAVERKKMDGITGDLHNAYYFLALLHNDLSDYKAAEEYFNKSIKHFSEAGGRLDYYTLMLKSTRAALIPDIKMSQMEIETLIDDAIMELSDKSEFFLSITYPFYILYYLRKNMRDKAGSMLEQALELAHRLGMRLVYALLCGLKANILSKSGDRDNAVTYAESFLRILAAEDCIQPVLTHPELMCAIGMGMEKNIEPVFIERVIKKLQAKAIPMLEELASVGDPAVRLQTVYYMKLIDEGKASRMLEYMFFEPGEKIHGYAAEELRSSGIRKLLVSTLGDFRIYCSSEPDTPISWRTSKACELFAYFFHHRGRLVSKEKILDDLWKEENPKQASMLLYTNIYNIRKIFKNFGIENGIISGQNGYMLDFSFIASDSECFEAIAKEVQSMHNSDILLLEKAISIYGGAYMQDRGWPWADSRREKLRRYYLYILKRASEVCTKNNLFEKAEKYLTLLLAEEPYHESAYIELMKTYHVMGDKTSIKNTFDNLCRVLMEDLNILPDEATTAMYLKLINRQ